MFEVFVLAVGVVDGHLGLDVDLLVGEEDGLDPCFDLLLDGDGLRVDGLAILKGVEDDFGHRVV